MPSRIHYDDPDFSAAFERLVGAKRDSDANVDDVVASILADVRKRGLEAVLEYTERFDKITLQAETIALAPDEIDAAVRQVSSQERASLELAADRIRAFHERQMPRDESWTDEAGVTLGWRWTAVESAGLYVPGGLASYPSSVLMNAIPAAVAGVDQIVMCVPTPSAEINPLVVCAARLCGIETIYRIGGAQAIGALAYGAAPILPVDKITGPGNAYVAAAKRQVFGHVGIDMIAGPSEVLIIADHTANPEWIALDLMAQAEHDASAQSILITDSEQLAEKVASAVAALLETLERRAIASASWRDFGGIVVVSDIMQSIDLTNRIAPEHLEIQTSDPDILAAQIRHAGAIFLGAYSPEAIGDYVGGPNHVLPTAGSAKFSSGLSVFDFLKRTTLSSATPAALKSIGKAAATLARSEQLEAHALSVEKRLEALN